MVSQNAATESAHQSTSSRKSRITLLKFLVICLPLWLSIKFYNGPFYELFQDYLAGILFIIIWALIVQMIMPGRRATPVLIGLFLVFCAIELICWQFPGLVEGVSITLAGHTLIGENFSLHKIPYYGVGAFIGYFILQACRIK